MKHLNKYGRRAFLKKAGITVIAVGTGSLLVACNAEQPTAPINSPASTFTGFEATALAGQATPRAGNNTVAPQPSSTAAPARTTVAILSTPKDTATAYLKAWAEKRYKDMYALLSDFAKSAISEEKFIGRYDAIAEEATMAEIKTTLNPTLPPLDPKAATYDAPFSVSFKTVRVGEFSQQNKMPLQLEGGKWGVNWSSTLIFTQLETGRLVRMMPSDSLRGLVTDSKAVPLAKEGIAYTVFVVPGKIDNEALLLSTLSQALGMDSAKIKAAYITGQPDWRMPIKDLPGDTTLATLDKLVQVKGVGYDEKKTRSYPQGNSAAHVIGYISAINADDLKKLAGKGYREDDVIGRTGIEEWGEDKLTGGKGGKLTVIEASGKVAETIKEQPSTPATNFTLTLDMKIQKAAEEILGDKMGSIVVITPDGAVLAMASSPRYNPNDFVRGLTNAEFQALNNDPRRPFQHRAANGLLPMGSTFKVITTSAALERIGMKMDTSFTCTGRWTGLGEEAAKFCYLKTGHGSITLYEGLVQSCDYVFYEVGKRLDEADSLLLPAVTKGFGLGVSTGINGLFDSPGQVPDPAWKKAKIGDGWARGDAVNLGIGQGYLLATPLQVAAVYAGIANGVAIPKLRLIARMDGGTTQAFNPEQKQMIPLAPGNMAQLRNALKDVTGGGKGAGTARLAFGGSKVKVAGKTGTAESGKEEPHAWFACYAPADNPKYVIVVVLENGGFGNEKAAPLARQLIDRLDF